MPKKIKRKSNNLETCNPEAEPPVRYGTRLKLETKEKRKKNEIASGAERPRNDGREIKLIMTKRDETRNDGKKARHQRNQPKDRLEISIVNGKATIQDYSEEHDSEKLIEMLKAMGIKSKIESDGPCG